MSKKGGSRVTKKTDGEKKKRFTPGKLAAIVIALIVIVYMGFSLLLFGTFMYTMHHDTETATEQEAAAAQNAGAEYLGESVCQYF